MNNDEFIKQAVEFLKSEYSEFVLYQNVVWDIFVEFNTIAKNNNLRYFMGFGSLIGVVRDKGKIPWDYDIDVIISIDDRERLIHLLDEELGEDYYYTYTNNLKTYPATCLRICKRGYPFTSIHLDVYFAIGCPEKDAQRFVNRVDRYHVLRFLKYGRIWFPNNNKSRLQRFANIAIRVKGSFINSTLLRAKEEKIWHKYKLDQSKHCCIIGDPYLHFYETAWFKKSIELSVDGINVSVPIGYDSFLRKIYKDYTTYLPIDNRYNEFSKMLHHIRERQNVMNNSNLYDSFK